MTATNFVFVDENLRKIFEEIKLQTNVANSFSPEFLDFDGCMWEINSFIEAAEYGLAYQFLVGLLELHPFTLSGSAVIKLLEVGLLFGYKTDRAKDSVFDKRVL